MSQISKSLRRRPRETFDAKEQFAESNDADEDGVWISLGKPLHDVKIRVRLGEFRDHVRVG